MPSDCLRPCGVPWAGKAGQSPWRSFAGRWALARIVEREAIFHPEFRQDLRYWVTTDRKAALRIFELIRGAAARSLHGYRETGAAEVRAGRLLVEKNHPGTSVGLSV